MIILIYLLKIKLASNFLDDSTEPKKKFDVSQFERSPFFQDFFPIDDCVHQAKDNSSKDLEVLNNNQNPETEENSGQLQKFKVREDDRDDRKVLKAKIFKKKRPFLKKQEQLDIRDLSTDNLRIRISAFKASPYFNRKLRVERDLYETIFQMEEFLKTERKLLEIPIHLEDIETICSKIKQSQLGPSPNDILYLIYTCFVTQAFKRFNNRKLYAKACILSLEQESDVFYEEDMLISFDIWRNLRFRCNTFDQAYHRLMVARNLISPNLEGIMSDLFDLQYEYKMLEGLRYFFD